MPCESVAVVVRRTHVHLVRTIVLAQFGRRNHCIRRAVALEVISSIFIESGLLAVPEVDTLDVCGVVDELVVRAPTLQVHLAESLGDEFTTTLTTNVVEHLVGKELAGSVCTPSKNPYTMSAAVGKDDFNLILKSKDGDEAHFIKIMFDGNFGEI